MQGLVDYSSDDTEEYFHKENGIKEEVSDLPPMVSSVNNIKELHNEDGESAEWLNMGFAAEQVASAVKACGKNCPGSVLLDFIQAHYGQTDDQLERESTEQHSGGPIVELLKMGFSAEHVASAVKACGETSVVSDLIDYIQAYYGDMEEHRQHDYLEELQNKDGILAIYEAKDSPETVTSIELKTTMSAGKQAASAMASCGELSAICFLVEEEKPSNKLATSGCNVESLEDEYREEVTPFRCRLGDLEEYGEESTTLKRLQKMGFSSFAVQRASEACGSIVFDDLLDYLIDHEKDDSDIPEDAFFDDEDEANDDEDEGCDNESTFLRLKTMGFSSSAIQNAFSKCETLNVEALLSFLLDGDAVSVHPTKEFSGFVKSKRLKGTGSRKPSTGFQVTPHAADPSQAISIRQTWADESTLKLWYSYLGLRSKVKISPLMDSDESESDCFGPSTWEAMSANQSKRKHLPTSSISWSQHKHVKGIGFGVPGYHLGRPKPIIKVMEGPPYFYFENVESVPNSEWDTIKRHFNGIDPEFTNSKYFSASMRPRGYVHNLPVEGRKLIIPPPPMTIFEALPRVAEYWPPWDTRQKLNCINTRRAPDTLCGLIRQIFTVYEGRQIPFSLQQEIILACKRWNLIWVGPGQTAPLEADELELILGYDRDHTRGCSSSTQRYNALGNSFQVNTVAYHLSPLKALYPSGLTVLSLFAGIGGAEVALEKLGIPLKAVVVVEINLKTRNVIASWWKKTQQKGKLQEKDDVKELTEEVLECIVDSVGRIDLIIGGSPCNNLSGNNRVSRVGLVGKESCLFFEFPRILNIVKQIMQAKGLR